MSATFFTLLLFGLAIASILPLPVWVLRRANRQRPYKVVLFLAFALTTALLYISDIGFFSVQINNYLLGIGIYGTISLVATLVFMFFGFKGEDDIDAPSFSEVWFECMKSTNSGGFGSFIDAAATTNVLSQRNRRERELRERNMGK